MSEIVCSMRSAKINPKGDIMVATWADLTDGDVGEPIHLPHSADKTVQVFGTFTGGGTVTIEGSNNLDEDVTKTYATLHKVDLSSLIYTGAGMDVIIENPNLVRPSVAGDGTTSITIKICLK